MLSQGAQKGRSSLVETRVRGVSIASQLPGAVPSAVPIPRSIPAVSCCAQAAITCRSPRSAGAVYPSQTLPVLARRRRRWRWRPQATAAIPPARPQRRPTRGQTHQLGAAHGRRARLRARRACVRVSAPVWSGAWTQMWRRLPDLKSRRLLLTMQDGGENFGRRRQGRRRGRRRVALPPSICASPPEHADGPLLSVGLTAAASTGTQAAAIRSLVASAAAVSDIPRCGDARRPRRSPPPSSRTVLWSCAPALPEIRSTNGLRAPRLRKRSPPDGRDAERTVQSKSAPTGVHGFSAARYSQSCRGDRSGLVPMATTIRLSKN